MKPFQTDTIVYLKNGEATIKECINCFGPHNYLVDYNGEKKILKWMPDGCEINNAYQNIQNLIGIGTISRQFLWPEDITELYAHGFGYILPVIPSDFVDYTEILQNKQKPSYKVLVGAGVHLSEALGALSEKGLTGYGFLSFLINTKNGNVLIPDDMVIVPAGTRLSWYDNPRAVAPEVSLGGTPDEFSNRFVLPKFLFELLFLSHPLEGKRYLVPCLTHSLQTLYIEDPVFIFDREDARNRPDPRIQKDTIHLWNETPIYVKEIFWKAFSKKALRCPELRPSEKEVFVVIKKFFEDL